MPTDPTTDLDALKTAFSTQWVGSMGVAVLLLVLLLCIRSRPRLAQVALLILAIVVSVGFHQVKFPTPWIPLAVSVTISVMAVGLIALVQRRPDLVQDGLEIRLSAVERSLHAKLDQISGHFGIVPAEKLPLPVRDVHGAGAIAGHTEVEATPTVTTEIVTAKIGSKPVVTDSLTPATSGMRLVESQFPPEIHVDQHGRSVEKVQVGYTHETGAIYANLAIWKLTFRNISEQTRLRNFVVAVVVKGRVYACEITQHAFDLGQPWNQRLAELRELGRNDVWDGHLQFAIPKGVSVAALKRALWFAQFQDAAGTIYMWWDPDKPPFHYINPLTKEPVL